MDGAESVRLLSALRLYINILFACSWCV